MIGNIVLPQELESSLDSDSKDFAVRADRDSPILLSYLFLAFSLFWLGLVGFIGFMSVSTLLRGEETSMTINGVDTPVSLEDKTSLIPFVLVLGVFVVIGIALFVFALRSFFRKGSYFVGTPTRLVKFRDGKLRSIDWEQFSGDISVSGSAEKGNIDLQMRTGRMVHKKRGPDQYVPDFLYIGGIPQAFEIEQICRKRIKENDPTPATSGTVVS